MVAARAWLLVVVVVALAAVDLPFRSLLLLLAIATTTITTAVRRRVSPTSNAVAVQDMAGASLVTSKVTGGSLSHKLSSNLTRTTKPKTWVIST
jgi:hypothetical protein